MNIFEKILRQQYWFLPTKNDERESYKKELIDIEKETPKVFQKMVDKTKQSQILLDKLEKTFTEEQ